MNCAPGSAKFSVPVSKVRLEDVLIVAVKMPVLTPVSFSVRISMSGPHEIFACRPEAGSVFICTGLCA